MHTLILARHAEEAEPLAQPRNDDDRVGTACIGHKQLGSGKCIRVARSHGAELEVRGLPRSTRFRHRQREAALAGRNSRKDRLLLSVRANERERLDAEAHGREVGRGENHGPHFFHQQPELERAEPAAAVFFGYDETDPAELCERTPSQAR